MKKADFSTAFSSSSPPKAIFNYKSSSYWVPPWKWKPPKISWLYQYENPKTCCFTPGKLLDPYEITMDSHGFPQVFLWVFLWLYHYNPVHQQFTKTMGTSHRFWTLGSEAMKDDRLLLEKLLRLDGRALRYASRKLRGERFGRGDGGVQKGLIIWL